MKTLPEIIQESALIESMLVDSQGEVTPEIEQLLEVNEKEFEHKIDAYKITSDKLKLSAEYWKARADMANKIARSCKSSSSGILNRIKEHLLSTGFTVAAGKSWKFKLSKCKEKVEIDKSLLPKNFLTEVIEYVPNKSLIADTMADGKTVPGVTVSGGFSMRAYPVK